ncbi:MAG: SDR family oxidoreductase [Chitinophagaceae bacterium]
MNLKKRKVLITGANGLLGQHLVTTFSKKLNFEVIATGKGETRNKNFPEVNYIDLDICNPQIVQKVILSHHPDIIIHGAAMTNVDECELNPEKCRLTNIFATQNLVDAARKVGAFFLFLSTDFIFDGINGPYKEEDQPNPISIYGESKLEAEKIVQGSFLKWAIARTVLVYGFVEGLSRTNIILWVKNSLERGKMIQVVDDQWRTPTLVQDLAEGCFLIASGNWSGIYNISGNELMTPFEMAIKTAEFFKLDKKLIQRSDGSIFQQAAKRPARTGFIVDKAIGILGYHPHSFEEGLHMLGEQLGKNQNGQAEQ